MRIIMIILSQYEIDRYYDELKTVKDIMHALFFYWCSLNSKIKIKNYRYCTYIMYLNRHNRKCEVLI